jgi:hypothetical protein
VQVTTKSNPLLSTTSENAAADALKRGKASCGASLLRTVYPLWWTSARPCNSSAPQNKSVAFVAKPLSVEADDHHSESGNETGPPRRGRLSTWFHNTFDGAARGEWQPVHQRRHRFFTARYGLFFDDLIGTPLERVGDTAFSRHAEYTRPSLRQRRASGPPRESVGGVVRSGEGESLSRDASSEILAPLDDHQGGAFERPAEPQGVAARVRELRHLYGDHLRPYYITTHLLLSVRTQGESQGGGTWCWPRRRLHKGQRRICLHKQ